MTKTTEDHSRAWTPYIVRLQQKLGLQARIREVATMFDVEAARLTVPVERAQLTAMVLCDASNSADADGDAQIAGGLANLSVRISRLGRIDR